MKTLIGMATFGNLPFTQLAINSIRATTRADIDFFVVVGKPEDVETSAWLSREGIAHTMHKENLGFPVSLNDMMDYAFFSLKANGQSPKSAPRDYPPLQMTLMRMSDGPCKLPAARPDEGYDNLIIAGNDIVAYPGAVDAMIEEAARGEWEWICSSQFDSKSLVARYPHHAQFFTGPTLNFEQWTSSEERGAKDYTPLVRPWEEHKDFHPPAVQPDCIKDVRNLCLFKRSVFEKIGYADVNFWPGGYFEDNDACTRARKAGVKACGLAHSAYFHFWSRTIHQGEGTNSRQFQRNAAFYATKWGGGFDHEAFHQPFNGQPYELGGFRGAAILSGALKIDHRDDEAAIVKHWRESK